MAKELKRRDLIGIFIFDTFPGESDRRPTCIEDCQSETRRRLLFTKSTEWQQYICDASEFNFNIPNLRSWMRGCHRIPKETFDTLRKMKQDLLDDVEEEKKRIKK